jgi:hypothetical protein
VNWVNWRTDCPLFLGITPHPKLLLDELNFFVIKIERVKQQKAQAGSKGFVEPVGESVAPPARKKRRVWRILAIILVSLVVLGGVGRALLPWAVRNYVNRTISRNPLYAGKIGDVEIHLWRGAYAIQDVRINKTTAEVPVPFFASKRVEFALEWQALRHRKAVGRVRMFEPEINFVDASNEGATQTGAEGDWLQMIRDLFPFKINSAVIKNGAIHFRAYQGQPPVDVYLSQVDGTIANLSNIRDETKPLVSTVEAKGLAMDQARFEFKMTLDPFAYRPTFHMAVRLLGLDVTKINDLALAYGKFDFKRGWFDLVIESDAKEGQLTGYIKPLFRNLKVFSLSEDLKEDNVLQFFWQALVGAVTRLLTNQARDQFGTLIPFTGDVSNSTSTDLLATIANILRNAFVRAYLPRLENPEAFYEGITFEPPDISEPITPNESP